MTDKPHNSLLRLAEYCGILTEYRDVLGNLQEADPEILIQVLRAKGVEISGPEGAEASLEVLINRDRTRFLQPCYLVEPHHDVVLPLHSTPPNLPGDLEVHLQKESGETLDARATLRHGDKAALQLPWSLEPGYHKIFFSWEGTPQSSHLLCSSGHAWEGSLQKKWGLFCPLYALQDETSWGSGSFTQLKALLRWTAGLGGNMVATLPLLAGPPVASEHPSPYLPWSRLFWDEFFLDVERIPEFAGCKPAKALVASPDFQNRLHGVQSAPWVDYLGIRRLKEAVLKILHREFLNSTRNQSPAYRHFLENHPFMSEYVGAKARAEGGSDLEPAKSYHGYLQFSVETQLTQAAQIAADSKAALCLDYPVGVDGDGLDGRIFPGLFVSDVSVGAPPDPFFSQGQNWGFPPMDPEAIRSQGYAYFSQALKHQLRFAKILRMDHIMGLHRLFWIPKGADAKQGVYVRYRPEEFYGVLALESQRHASQIVGEDLGTVPPEIRPAMTEHGLLRTWVAQFSDLQDFGLATSRIPQACMASLNTHDMPPFAAFWGDRPDPARALEKLLGQLAKSPAAWVSVNLEDLWLERRPQNLPGTHGEHPNWKGKLRRSWEEFRQDPELIRMLGQLHRLRNSP